MVRISASALYLRRSARGHSVPFPHTRTISSAVYRAVRFIYLKYALGLLALALPAYGFTQNLVSNIVSVILGLASIYLAFKVWYRDMHSRDIWPLMPINIRKTRISGPMQDSGYDFVRRRGVSGDALLTSDDINRALLCNVTGRLEIDEETFRAAHSEQVSQILLNEFKKQKGTVLFDSKKVRLASEPRLGNDGQLVATRIQPTRYYDTLITNDALNASVRFGSNQNKEFDGHDFCFPNGVVPECSLSQCANQIGMSTIAFTSDNCLVIVGQKDASAFSKRLWAPSGSGSADWKDVGVFKDLQEFVKFAARRELVEECGLHVSDVEWLRIFGYGRLLHRGGLPQFFCLARLNCTFDKVKITKPERPLVAFHEKIYYQRQGSNREFVHATREMLLNNSHVVSSVLWYCFELLWRMPEADLDRVFLVPEDRQKQE
jgi:8-oxo-dGTP pyrophosphatase MutT (NUDIX family)